MTTAIKDISAEDIVAVNSGRPISVCEALKNRAMYDLKVVELRARFYGNSIGDSCGSFRTEKLEWPSVIELPWPGNSLYPPVTWNVDPGWYNRLTLEASRVGAGKRKQRRPRKVVLEEPVYGPAGAEYLGQEDLAPLATVIGRFESRPDIDLQGNHYGYGHLNGLPARLIIIDVRDLAPFTSPPKRAR